VDNQAAIAEQAQFVPLTEEQAQEAADKVARLAG